MMAPFKISPVNKNGEGKFRNEDTDKFEKGERKILKTSFDENIQSNLERNPKGLPILPCPKSK